MKALLHSLVIILILPAAASGKCRIPEYLHGQWLHMENGSVFNTIITADKWEINSDRNNERTELTCEKLNVHPKTDSQGDDGNNVTMLMTKSDGPACYYCVDVLWRTPNVLQFQKGGCIKDQSGMSTRNILSYCMYASGQPQNRQPFVKNLETLFRKSPQKMNCNDILVFDGIYQFSYEMEYRDDGVCNSSKSQIEACQVDGSPYVDNEVFHITYDSCPGVSTPRHKKVRYQCMGAWSAEMYGQKYKFAAVRDVVESNPKEEFKCMLTIEHAMWPQEYWVMSRFSQCRHLQSLYRGPVRLRLTRKRRCEN
ncbi:uncharacterized protein LOC130047955 [Ostrea edulis]|uniref:uncharacterized protein LOC130047955 n=1 Tax=Ostrea edulis TaxID=37623 RepID=UPI0024AF75B3|nr:uncharacterized protein LOC130047955 [Ostrea edulis]